MEFFQEVYRIVRAVPSGKVITYGQVARLAGNQHMARQVGWALHNCDQTVPWHRVVNREGGLIPDALAAQRQKALLEAEGVQFTQSGCVKKLYFLWEP